MVCTVLSCCNSVCCGTNPASHLHTLICIRLAVNLRGTFLMTKYALSIMESRNYGRILNFASIAGKEGNAGMSPYSSSKAGVIGLVKSAGKEFAETGITVNAIAPAVIRTPMVDGVDPDQVKYMTDKIPMKRCGTLDEVAALACWIVSPEASFNTAAVFDLTGGRATYEYNDAGNVIRHMDAVFVAPA